MNKIIIYLNYIVLIICAIAVIIVNSILKFDIASMYSTLLLLLFMGVFESLMVSFREYKGLNKKDSISKASLISSIILVIFATGDFYALKAFKKYDEFGFIYWIIIGVGVIATIIGFVVCCIKFKKNDNKPKFIVNNRK